MSTKSNIALVDLEKTVMAKVKSNEIVIKPRWYFILGSLLTMGGLVGLSIGAIFLTNLTVFLLSRHGPMGQWRLQVLLNSFPLWIPTFAVASTALGIRILRKYDFSYKKNFWVVVMGFILSIILVAILLDYLGLNDIWSRKGPMRGFYHR